ncbi:MAG: hypothetical protein JW702_03035, partial [Clostridiales bacterium]|nr:hypothetical protein [Clostridiales bacterium]
MIILTFYDTNGKDKYFSEIFKIVTGYIFKIHHNVSLRKNQIIIKNSQINIAIWNQKSDAYR